MNRELARRLGLQTLRLAFVMWLVSVLVFLALRLTPGDPAVLLLGPQAGRPDAAAQLEHLRREMGLDRSWPVQYAIWAGDLLRGDLGVSSRSGVSVVDMMAGALPSTMWLLVLSVLISVPTSIVLGMSVAGRGHGWADRLMRTATTLAVAIPGVWLGLLAIIAFTVKLQVLPAGGYVDPLVDPMGFIQGMTLPVFTLSVYLTGVLTRFVYAEASEVQRQDFMRTATAMGVSPRRRLFVYAAKNAVLPMITVVGVQISALVGGAVLIEAVFTLGGLGQLLLSSVLNRDYQVVQGVVLLTTIVVLVMGYVSDIAYRLVDPRISR